MLSLVVFGVFLSTARGYGSFNCAGKSNGDYPDPTNCHGYITCSNGITYHRPCPAGLVWNAAAKLCDWKHNVPPPCGTVIVTTSASSDFCSSKTNGNYPDPNNCHGYIACSNGITYHMPCPAGLVWHDATKRCDYGALTTLCSIDDIVRYVLDAMPKTNGSVNNHLVGALYQVVKGMQAAKGIPKNVGIDKDEMIDRIKKALNHRGYTYARTVIGFILQKQENCKKTGGMIIKEIKHVLGNDIFQDLLGANGGVTLMFVIDTTGSMAEEISEAKAIAKAIARYERKGKVNYVLSPYNDPGSGPVTKFSHENRAGFEAAISNLVASGGGDCNELTFNGIIDAINIGNPLPNSPMYVFTDAPPKPRGVYTRDNAIKYAQDNNIKVNFFFSTRGCNDPGNNPDYKAIMASTGGLGLFFRNASAIRGADALVKIGLDGSITISSGTRGGSSEVAFPVDESVANLIVSISAIYNWNNVNLIDPSGGKVAHTLALNRGKLWVIKSPEKGTWRLSIASGVRGLLYEIKASALSNIEFDHMFVRTTLGSSGRVVPISNPLIGEKATVRLFVPHISRLNRGSLNADLVNEQGASIKKLTINCADTAVFDLPSARAFRIRLSGKTKDGNSFQRLSREVIEPQTAILRTQITESLLAIKRGVESLFHAAIDFAGAGSRKFSVTASVIPSYVRASVTNSLTVTNASPGIISVRLTAPSRTPVGTIVKVHVHASSGNIKLNLLAQLMVK